MANPWTKKNPFLSMFLSSANAAAGRTRGWWSQQAKRNQTTAVKQAARSWQNYGHRHPAPSANAVSECQRSRFNET